MLKLLCKLNINLLSTLVVLVPLYNILSIWLTKFYTPLVFWKEAILVLICIIATRFLKPRDFKLFGIWIVLVSFSVFSSFIFNVESIRVYLIGFRFELLWVGFLSIIVPFFGKLSFENLKKIEFALILSNVLTIILSFSSLIFGSDLTNWLGFEDCHKIDFGIDTCRLSFPFTSSNHFGGVLVLFIGFFAYKYFDNNTKKSGLNTQLNVIRSQYELKNNQDKNIFKNKIKSLINNDFDNNSQELNKTKNSFQDLLQLRFLKNTLHGLITKKISLIYLILVLLNLWLLFLTYSRSAWIAGILIFGVGLLYTVFNVWKTNYNLMKKSLCPLDISLRKGRTIRTLFFKISMAVILLILGFSLTITSINPDAYTRFLPTFLAKPSSTIEHYRLTAVNLEILGTNPDILLTGNGLGQSGPAANYFDLSENTIKKNYGQLTYKWFINEDRIVIPESWYLQLVLNGGLFYAFIWLVLVTVGLWNFIPNIKEFDPKLFLQLGLLGILVMNLFLHIFESQAVVVLYIIISGIAFVKTKKS